MIVLPGIAIPSNIHESLASLAYQGSKKQDGQPSQSTEMVVIVRSRLL
jgi:hypothetical protein